MKPLSFEEHQKQLAEWASYLRSHGWEQGERNLWVDPERPNIRMSLRTAYYTQVRKGQPRTLKVEKETRRL